MVLLGGEEVRRAWVGGRDEVGEEPEAAGDAAFDDEDPPMRRASALLEDDELVRAYFHPGIPYVPSRECIAVARRPPNAPVRDTVE